MSRTLALVPALSVLLAVRNDERFVAEALHSVLRQTFRDLELIVVNDASTDGTRSVLERIADGRLVVLTNGERMGLAASLNRAIDRAQGRYLARLDSDDVALPERFARQIETMRTTGVAALGTAVHDLDERGEKGRLHRMPNGERAVRWHALFSSPFFHPTVLVDREALGDLRYDTSFAESEDYDLWTRLLATGVEGANLDEPLVLKRVHATQASVARSDVQRSFQRRVALREISRVASDIDGEAAWSFAVERSGDATAYRRLLAAFESKHGVDREVRSVAIRTFARAGKVAAMARILLGPR